MIEAILSRLVKVERALGQSLDILYGTVTQSSPLRVRLDGDTNASNYAPDMLGEAILAVNERVACVSGNGRLLILGGLSGDAASKAIRGISERSPSTLSHTPEAGAWVTLDSFTITMPYTGMLYVDASCTHRNQTGLTSLMGMRVWVGASLLQPEYITLADADYGPGRAKGFTERSAGTTIYVVVEVYSSRAGPVIHQACNVFTTMRPY